MGYRVSLLHGCIVTWCGRFAFCLAWLACGLNASYGLAAEEPIPALRPPRDELRASFWEQHGWVVVLAVVLVLAALAVWLMWVRRPTPGPIQPPVAIARAA